MDRIKTADLARGRWPRILRALGVPDKILNKKHQPCPFCGGKDRFRFTDYQERGFFLCNQCGTYNGFQFLMKLRGWNYKQAADAIDDVLSGSAIASMSREAYEELLAEDRWESRVHKSTRDAAKWLYRFHPERFEAWLDARHPEVRVWWESQR